MATRTVRIEVSTIYTCPHCGHQFDFDLTEVLTEVVTMLCAKCQRYSRLERVTIDWLRPEEGE